MKLLPAVHADPTKSLKAEKADARMDKPQQPGEVRDDTLNPTGLLGQLQVYQGTPSKGNFPHVRPQPGQRDHTAYKAAFTTWMEGDGKGFEIKRFVQPGEKK